MIKLLLLLIEKLLLVSPPWRGAGVGLFNRITSVQECDARDDAIENKSSVHKK